MAAATPSSRRRTRTSGSIASSRSASGSRADWSTSRSARRATLRRPAVIAALSSSNAERGYPPSIGTAAPRERSADWMQRRFDDRRVARARRRHASAPRSSSARCRNGCSLRTPTATRCCTRRSPTPPTRWGPPWRVVGRVPVPLAPQLVGSIWRRSTTCRRRPSPGAVGQQPRQPHRRAGRSRRGRGVGPRPRRAGVLRRVLRRVHVGRPRPHDSRTRARWRRRRALVVEALEPGRGRVSASTPATPSWSSTSARCASTSG